MTFRVIEGGGRPRLAAAGTLAEARAEIIDRVAAAIWAFQDEAPDPAYATWEEIKALALNEPGRAYLVRQTLAQARGAIRALRSATPPEAEHMVFSHGLGCNPEEFADGSTMLDLFVEEVLR